MTTSPKAAWRSAGSVEDAAIDPATLGYFHGLSRDEAHELVLSLFLKLAEEDGLTMALLARRLGKAPEQITRWLSAPGNWTLDTLASLLLALGYRPRITAELLPKSDSPDRDRPASGAPALEAVRNAAEEGGVKRVARARAAARSRTRISALP